MTEEPGKSIYNRMFTKVASPFDADDKKSIEEALNKIRDGQGNGIFIPLAGTPASLAEETKADERRKKDLVIGQAIAAAADKAYYAALGDMARIQDEIDKKKEQIALHEKEMKNLGKEYGQCRREITAIKDALEKKGLGVLTMDHIDPDTDSKLIRNKVIYKGENGYYTLGKDGKTPEYLDEEQSNAADNYLKKYPKFKTGDHASVRDKATHMDKTYRKMNALSEGVDKTTRSIMALRTEIAEHMEEYEENAEKAREAALAELKAGGDPQEYLEKIRAIEAEHINKVAEAKRAAKDQYKELYESGKISKERYLRGIEKIDQMDMHHADEDRKIAKDRANYTGMLSRGDITKEQFIEAMKELDARHDAESGENSPTDEEHEETAKAPDLKDLKVVPSPERSGPSTHKAAEMANTQEAGATGDRAKLCDVFKEEANGELTCMVPKAEGQPIDNKHENGLTFTIPYQGR